MGMLAGPLACNRWWLMADGAVLGFRLPADFRHARLLYLPTVSHEIDWFRTRHQDRLALIHPLKRGHLRTVQFTKQSSPEKVKTKVQWILSLKRIDINNRLFLYSSVQASVIFKKGVIQRPNSGTVLSPFGIISVSCPDFTLLCMSQGGETLCTSLPSCSYHLNKVFIWKLTSQFLNLYKNTKDPEQPRWSRKKSYRSQSSGFIIKPQQSMQYGIGVRINRWINGTKYKGYK